MNYLDNFDKGFVSVNSKNFVHEGIHDCMALPVEVAYIFGEENIYTDKVKKRVLDTFRAKVYRRYKDLKNFVEVTCFEKGKRAILQKNGLYKAFKNKPIGLRNWYQKLTYEEKEYIFEYCKGKYKLRPRGKIKKNLDRKFGLYKWHINDFDEKATANLDKRYVKINEDGSFYIDYIEIDANVQRHEMYKKDELLEKQTKLYQLAIEDGYDFFDENNLLKQEVLEKYVVNGAPIPMTTKEKMRLSIKRSYATFKDYLQTNVDKFENFITLTFAPKEQKEKHSKLNNARNTDEYDLTFNYVDDEVSYDICIKCLNVFFTSLKKQLRKKYELNLYYLGVPEYHKDGRIHYHFLTSYIPKDLLYKVPSWLDYDYITNQKRNDYGFKNWTYGKSTIEKIECKARITTYLSKYMLKSLNNLDNTIYLERLNKQRFYKTHNLEKPKVSYEDIINISNHYDKLVQTHTDIYTMTEIKKYTFTMFPVDKREETVF